MIDGNQTVQLQVASVVKNGLGEGIESWKTVPSIRGWLDLSSGDSSRTTYNAKIQESTPVCGSDYVKLNASSKAENSRLIDEDGLIYDVLLIDDPMKFHKQLEIYLKYTGGPEDGSEH